ncbi:alpha/beta fold hydrolase [Microbulbifer sp. THAF38]|uniref:alpha/beta fold hydrolase n=1 Tax=Microbulbifer sp. THAF38 TaxID=2587856 RepID=UPI0012692183|nr:alpha/beta fold hydrolase [Microbulbifer sp. THAF38]QFT55641.1 Alpha/beta hydrolase family protein [Microbulbifer sp. THAF38]
MSEYIIDRPQASQTLKSPKARFLFAHGAGAPMDSDFMQALAVGLCKQGIEVVRFEFPYMVQRRSGGSKRPPNTMPQLQECFEAQIERFAGDLPLFIGGKSMGGRVASLLADKSFEQGLIAGLICLGYPFHPQGKPDKLRTEHLLDSVCPTLIVQGDRDPLGSREEVVTYGLSDSIEIEWLADGDHDFKPRRASGYTQAQHWASAIDKAAGFMQRSPGS